MNSPLQFGIPSLDALFARGRMRAVPDPNRRERRNTSWNYDTSPDYEGFGIRLSPTQPTTSLCMIGPDGAGKSVFGLHLAAQYMADHHLPGSVTKDKKQTWCPRVLYVSTDLKHDVANLMWNNFGLGDPNHREFPFSWGCRNARPSAVNQVDLFKLDPAAVEVAFLDGPAPDQAKVHFVDLVSKTMGDDWSFINRLLALLKTPGEKCAPHLLIIDAVEGFETLVGDRDAFGETTSRRARIAQIMRTAGEKCHVCFIVEEPKAEARFPEEFVTDVVVRLRSVNVRNYARRTIEIIKARGQSHVRGQHPFVIRGRGGSTTGQQQNADDPETRNGYIHVYPSLHVLSREEMKAQGPINPKPDAGHVAAFGITYLDEMLARLEGEALPGFDDQGLRAQTATALIGEFATQKTSLAIAFLARTFRVFIFELADIIRELVSEGKTGPMIKVKAALAERLRAHDSVKFRDGITRNEHVEEIIAMIRSNAFKKLTEICSKLNGEPITFASLRNNGLVPFAAWLAAALPVTGATVLITTSDQNPDRLTEEFGRWLANSRFKSLSTHLKDVPALKKNGSIDEFADGFVDAFWNAVEKHMTQRTVCRRLELHDLSSPILFHIIQRSVQRAQEAVFLSDCLSENVDRLPSHRTKRYARSGNIRVVIDDLNTLKDTYPEIGSDPLFLPFLLQFLELEGVTSLIIDSQVGRPDAIVSDSFDRELRALVPHKLLTWRVPFFGSIRDAITLVPPYPNGLRSVVREVRWQSHNDGTNALVVDPEIELYSGLEKGEPKPIPLEVRLYPETGSMGTYISEENQMFRHLFTPLEGQNGPRDVIIGVELGQYNALHDFCNLQTNTLLNHTMVFQVDEFWATDRVPFGEIKKFPRGPIYRRERALSPLGPYLIEETESGNPMLDRITDPYGVFYGRPAVLKEPSGATDEEDAAKGPWQRRQYFARSSQDAKKPRNAKRDAEEVARIDRVPFSWDFGFLLCPKRLWDLAGAKEIGHEHWTVRQVWENMPSVVNKGVPGVSWRIFLGACKAVSEVQLQKGPVSISALDVSNLAPESFLCLVLEIWASEILDMLPPNQRVAFIKSVDHIDWSEPGSQGLLDWLHEPDYRLAFYKTWLLLAESLPLASLTERKTIPRLKGGEADGSSAATRHWYKTACKNQLCPITNELSLPVRLPGSFSVRGDWFLAVAGGSRSERLGRRALDLLSTRRANFRRMELGIGLPTRDISSIDLLDQLPTALSRQDESGPITSVMYGDLVGSTLPPPKPPGTRKFHWLWRSQLHHYHRESRLLHSWVGQTLAQWDDLHRQSNWQSGLKIYDSLANKSHADAAVMMADNESWSKFEKSCFVLEKQLKIIRRSGG